MLDATRGRQLAFLARSCGGQLCDHSKQRKQESHGWLIRPSSDGLIQMFCAVNLQHRFESHELLCSRETTRIQQVWLSEFALLVVRSPSLQAQGLLVYTTLCIGQKVVMLVMPTLQSSRIEFRAKSSKGLSTGTRENEKV